MPFLRQSTAQTILFGPCLDMTDGVTEETALTLAQADMRLSKDGGAFAQKSAAGNATHDSDGWYSTSLSTTDTATVGELILNVHQPANMLPVWTRWWVIEEAVYDAIYGAAAAGPLQGTTAGNTLDVNATGEAGLDLDNTSGTIAAAQIATGAITAAKFAASAIDAAALATDAVDEIVDGVWNEDATAHQTGGTFGQAIGDPGANTETMYDAVVTDATGINVATDVVAVKAETALIVADTNELQTDWVDAGRLDAILDGRMAETSISTTGGAVDTVTALTGHTGQTGDNFARIGAAGASLTDLGGMSAGMTAEVNAEVADVLKTDTVTLPGQVAPPLAPTFEEMISWLYKALRNRKTQTSTQWSLLADNETTVDAKATVSDDATTAIKQEIVSGP